MNDAEEDFDVLNWLGEEESFFMVIEVNESLCREAETVLEEIGDHPIQSFQKMQN
ncbi:hypothetical protein EfmAA610_18810 [Enterococcus faecium]|nr:hypothetical protein EfmAA610_18810 [Enterococcus faecium]